MYQHSETSRKMKFPLIQKKNCSHFNKILFYIFYERKDSTQVNKYEKFKVIRIAIVKVVAGSKFTTSPRFYNATSNTSCTTGLKAQFLNA